MYLCKTYDEYKSKLILLSRYKTHLMIIFIRRDSLEPPSINPVFLFFLKGKALVTSCVDCHGP